jgi:hypothetical protein
MTPLSCRLLTVACTFALVLSAVPLALAAEPITYSFAGYPADQVNYSGQCWITGTIVTNGSIGTLHKSDILGGSFTIGGATFNDWGYDYGGCYPIDPAQVSNGTGSESILGSDLGTLYATETEILMPMNAGLHLQSPPPVPWYGKFMRITWIRTGPETGVTSTIFSADGGDGYGYGKTFWNVTSNPPATPGHISANDPWVIATVVPEPGTLALLGGALVGLSGIAYVRFRRRS